MPAFRRVIVDYFFTGPARITWELDPHFVDSAPYTFQLQVSQGAGVATADDWTNVGSAIQSASSLTDTTRRNYGKTATVAYRIQLTTNVGTYLSDPAEVLGKFRFQDWIFAQEIIRKELLRHKTFGSVSGFLLKARRYGTQCINTDALTGEVLDGNCTICYGTGIVGGYFPPVSAFFVDQGLSGAREHRNLEGIGTEKNNVISGRIIAQPNIVQGDAWVNDGSDERYYIHSVKELAIYKGVPIIYQVELRQAAFSDILYQVPITQ